MKQRIVIIGATSTIAEYCAREWINQKNTELVLIGRDKERLEIVAQDLSVRNPNNQVMVRILHSFTEPKAINQLVDALCSESLPAIVLIAHGVLADQAECQHDLVKCKAALEINGISPVLLAEAFAKQMSAGVIAVIGSVAGDRGRQSNYVYGAAKGLIDRYLQGMQHRFYHSKLKIIRIKPGPTETKMTTHLKNTAMKLADAQYVAHCIVKGIAQGKTVIYAPKRWAFIMMIVRHIPNCIFGKLRI